MESLLECLNAKLDELEQVLVKERKAALSLNSEALREFLVQRESIPEAIRALADRRLELFRVMGLPLEATFEDAMDRLPKEAAERIRPDIRVFQEKVGCLSAAISELKNLTACSLAWLDGLFDAMRQAGQENDGQRYTPYGALEVLGGVAHLVSRRT
jgi:hypothetical protein